MTIRVYQLSQTKMDIKEIGFTRRTLNTRQAKPVIYKVEKLFYFVALISLLTIQVTAEICRQYRDHRQPPIQIQAVGNPIPITEPTSWSGAIPRKIGASSFQDEMIAYGWNISKDRDFIHLIEAESGWVLDRVSYQVGANGHYDYGLCQINSGWHSDIVSDSRFQANDWKWELDTCLKLYQGGTRFYGLDNLEPAKENIYWVLA